MNINPFFITSLAAYIATIVGGATLLIIEPNGFDARATIAPLVTLMFLSSLGIAYKFASKTKSKGLKIAGTLSFAVLLTFIGFFIVAAVAWFVALSHAQ